METASLILASAVDSVGLLQLLQQLLLLGSSETVAIYWK